MVLKKHSYKGVNYRSTGEMEIAKFLIKMNFDFEYEFPIAVIDEGKTKIWYPDFYLKEFQIVIEYFGMYNYDENYRDGAEHKKSVFKKCGIQFIPIYELKPNWKEYVLDLMENHLEIKLKKIAEAAEKHRNPGKFQSIVKRFFNSTKKKPFKGPNRSRFSK